MIAFSGGIPHALRKEAANALRQILYYGVIAGCRRVMRQEGKAFGTERMIEALILPLLILHINP